MKTVVQIPVWEYERGWGGKVDDYMICSSVDDGERFIVEFNSENNKTEVPDWYMVAEVDIRPIDITDEQYEELIASPDKRKWKRGFLK